MVQPSSSRSPTACAPSPPAAPIEEPCRNIRVDGSTISQRGTASVQPEVLLQHQRARCQPITSWLAWLWLSTTSAIFSRRRNMTAYTPIAATAQPAAFLPAGLLLSCTMAVSGTIASQGTLKPVALVVQRTTSHPRQRALSERVCTQSFMMLAVCASASTGCLPVVAGGHLRWGSHPPMGAMAPIGRFSLVVGAAGGKAAFSLIAAVPTPCGRLLNGLRGAPRGACVLWAPR